MSEAFHVSALIEKRRSTSPWVDFSWHVAAVVTDTAQSGSDQSRTSAETARFLVGPLEVAAHPSDTAGYRDNLNSGTPKLWVVLRPADDAAACDVMLITADPAEGEAMTQNGDLLVEAVTMPDAVRVWLEAFVREHHVERPFHKRKRD